MLIVMLIFQTRMSEMKTRRLSERVAPMYFYIELFCLLISISIPLFEIFLFFLKGSLFKSNRVCLSMWRLQSLTPWSGLSILSPTSWLFKGAKEEERSFLNTQIHVCRRRDRCLAKEPPYRPLLLPILFPLFLLTLGSDSRPLIIHPPP